MWGEEMTSVKATCDDCDRVFVAKRLKRIGSGFYCHFCWIKGNKNVIKRGGNQQITLKEALNNTYQVKLRGKTYPTGIANFPRCLIGKKFKLRLIR